MNICTSSEMLANLSSAKNTLCTKWRLGLTFFPRTRTFNKDSGQELKYLKNPGTEFNDFVKYPT